jgi:hypothetical protein
MLSHADGIVVESLQEARESQSGVYLTGYSSFLRH